MAVCVCPTELSMTPNGAMPVFGWAAELTTTMMMLVVMTLTMMMMMIVMVIVMLYVCIPIHIYIYTCLFGYKAPSRHS